MYCWVSYLNPTYEISDRTEADINLLRKQQKRLSKHQKFKGDKAYISADRTTTPYKKKKNQKLTQVQKEENRKIRTSLKTVDKN